MVWYVYLLSCVDDSLYCGVTTDVKRRIAEHNGDRPGGARYTRARRPVQLAWVETCNNRSEATRREAVIKNMDRAAKKALVSGFHGLK